MWVSLPELSAVLGAEQAELLATSLAGAELYVPARPKPGHRLEAVLGEDGLRTLCAEYGGISIKLPNPRRDTRKERVFALLGQGLTRREIARRCAVTERYVYRLASLERSSSSEASSRVQANAPCGDSGRQDAARIQ